MDGAPAKEWRPLPWTWRSPGFEGKASLAGRRWVWQACHRQWSRDGAGGMSCGEDAGQLENNHDEEQAASSASAAQQNVFREVFDERSEPSDTGEGLKRHAVWGRERGRSVNHQQDTQSHILIQLSYIQNIASILQ